MPTLQSAKAKQSSISFLRASQLFAPLDDETFAHIAEELEWLEFDVEEPLFAQGSPGDSLYVLVFGRLGVEVTTAEGETRFVGEIHPGEPIGEMSMFTNEVRSATVFALRDCLVVRLSRQKFTRLLEQKPKAMIAINRLLIDRLRRTTSAGTQHTRRTHIFALVPVSRDVPLLAFGEMVAAEMSLFGRVLMISGDEIVLAEDGICQPHPSKAPQTNDTSSFLTWLNEQEQTHDSILLISHQSASLWTEFCLRYADALLLLADAQQRPNGHVIDQSLLLAPRSGVARKRKLLLIQPDHIKMPTGTARWLDFYNVDDHHHIRLGQQQDRKRLTRFLLGRAIGLGLAGGAARGFAHIGVMKALEECEVPIDLTCGASVGATLGALYALGVTHEEVAQKMHPFFNLRIFTDVAVPVVSFLNTTYLNRIFDQMFGDIFVEDLWLHFFSASSNLTNAEVYLFHRGRLADAVRASGSLPGFYPPFIKPSGELLVDGAVLSNLPTASIDRSLCGKLISVNVIPTLDKSISSGFPDGVSPMRMLVERINPFRTATYPGIFDIMMRSIFLNSIKDAELIRRESDLYIEPQVSRFGFFDFRAYKAIIDLGYESSRADIAAWVQSDKDLQQIIAANKRRL